MKKKIIDIKDMPNFNDEVKNGLDNVSKKEVFFGKNDWMPKFAVKTVCCLKHGAMNVVAKTEKGQIWRCIACNRGAFEIFKSTTQTHKK